MRTAENNELDKQNTKKPVLKFSGANHNPLAYHEQNGPALLIGFTFKTLNTAKGSNLLQYSTTLLSEPYNVFAIILNLFLLKSIGSTAANRAPSSICILAARTTMILMGEKRPALKRGTSKYGKKQFIFTNLGHL